MTTTRHTLGAAPVGTGLTSTPPSTGFYRPNVWPSLDQWAPLLMFALGVLLCLAGATSLFVLGLVTMLLGFFFGFLPLPIYLLAVQQRTNASTWPVFFAFAPGVGHLVTWIWGSAQMRSLKSQRGLPSARSRGLYMLAPRYALAADLADVLAHEPAATDARTETSRLARPTDLRERSRFD